MKKMLLTGAMALMGLMVSAQGFMVTADIDTDDFNLEGVTETLGSVSYTHLRAHET